MTTLDELDQAELRALEKRVRAFGSDNCEHFGGDYTGNFLLQQAPDEMAGFLAFLRERMPQGADSYIEIGSAAGGFIRAVFNLLGFKQAVMIDDGQHHNFEHQHQNIVQFREQTERFIGDSHSKKCKKFLEELERSYDLAFIDGDHSFEGVVQDVELIWPYLRPGALVGFHDSYSQEWPGVAKAILKIFKEGRPKVSLEAEFASPLTKCFGITVLRKL